MKSFAINTHLCTRSWLKWRGKSLPFWNIWNIWFQVWLSIHFCNLSSDLSYFRTSKKQHKFLNISLQSKLLKSKLLFYSLCMTKFDFLGCYFNTSASSLYIVLSVYNLVPHLAICPFHDFLCLPTYGGCHPCFISKALGQVRFGFIGYCVASQS